jgi:hypothetical protein
MNYFIKRYNARINDNSNVSDVSTWHDNSAQKEK